MRFQLAIFLKYANIDNSHLKSFIFVQGTVFIYNYTHNISLHPKNLQMQ